MNGSSQPSACATPASDEEITAYWLDEPVGQATERLEAHLMGCEPCSRRSLLVGELLALLAREKLTRGVPATPSAVEVARLLEAGLRVDEVAVGVGETPVVFRPGVDVVLVRFPLPGLASRASGDDEPARLELEMSIGDELLRFEDVPLHPQPHPGIVLACQRHYLTSYPSPVARCRVHRITLATRELLGEHTLVHRLEPAG